MLSVAQDQSDGVNFVSDDVSGYNVNCIALQIPFELILAKGAKATGGNALRQIGFWGTTSRAKETIRKPERPVELDGEFVQVQRMANPLFNELLIGTGFKDRWSRSQPVDEKRFQNMVLDPLIVRLGQAAFAAAGIGFPIPQPPHVKHKGSIVTGEYVTVAGNGGVPSWTLTPRVRDTSGPSAYRYSKAATSRKPMRRTRRGSRS